MSREWTIGDELRIQQGKISQTYRQGEAWVADISGGKGHEYGSETDPAKQRPVIVLSNRENASTHIVIICTTKAKYQYDNNAVFVPLPDKQGTTNSYALVTHVRTLDSSRFLKYIGKISDKRLKKMRKILMKITRID